MFFQFRLPLERLDCKTVQVTQDTSSYFTLRFEVMCSDVRNIETTINAATTYVFRNSTRLNNFSARLGV